MKTSLIRKIITRVILLNLAAQTSFALAEEAGRKETVTTFIIAAPFVFTSAPTSYTSDQTERLSAKDNKIILQAKADALIFVATEGQHKGIYLETALTLLRKTILTKQTTDLQLAQAIIIF